MRTPSQYGQVGCAILVVCEDASSWESLQRRVETWRSFGLCRDMSDSQRQEQTWTIDLIQR